MVEFPAILPSNKPIWPEYWKLKELEGVKASLSIGKWNAQWMQNPTAEEGSILKGMVETLGKAIYTTTTTYHSKL